MAIDIRKVKRLRIGEGLTQKELAKKAPRFRERCQYVDLKALSANLFIHQDCIIFRIQIPA